MSTSPDRVRRHGSRIRKPAYLYRPSQVIRRFLNTRTLGERQVLVPWGDRLWVDTTEMIGNSIARLGVWELAVTETMYRLISPGDTAIDLGANVGYYTSLMAHRAGPAGTVYAFEPHPVIHGRLKRNVAGFRSEALIRTDDHAISDHPGQAYLTQPAGFGTNMGGAQLGESGISVEVTTLDDRIAAEAISCLKMDIEGQELAALTGGERTFAATRHVIFEEYDPLPTAVTDSLVAMGFNLFGITERMTGPLLIPPEALQSETREAPTYLATRDDDITLRVRPDGWRCLRRPS